MKIHKKKRRVRMSEAAIVSAVDKAIRARPVKRPISTAQKPDDPHLWRITLCPATTSHGPTPRPTISEFAGNIEGVLREADELESEAVFDVQQFIITRGAPIGLSRRAAVASLP